MAASITLFDLGYAPPDGRARFSGRSLAFGPARTGLVGRNGVGKTTLLKLISGELSPRTGHASVNGRVAVLRQTVQLGPDETVASPFGVTDALDVLLERREVVHDLTEAERLCPCCGQPRACIGEQSAEQLDLGPVQFFVLRTVKKSYACRHCDPATVPVEQRIRTAGPAQVGPIAKGCAARGCWRTSSPPRSPITRPRIDSPANWRGPV